MVIAFIFIFVLHNLPNYAPYFTRTRKYIGTFTQQR